MSEQEKIEQAGELILMACSILGWAVMEPEHENAEYMIIGREDVLAALEARLERGVN